MEQTHKEVRKSQEEAEAVMAGECSDCQVNKARERHCDQGGLPGLLLVLSLFIDVKKSISIYQTLTSGV